MPRSLLLQGVAAFNAGNFLEAHELWEATWNDSVGEEKRFVQGLVLLATGYLKLSSGQYRGALKLLTRGSQALNSFPPIYDGLQISAVVHASSALVHQLEKGQPPTDLHPPPIQTIS